MKVSLFLCAALFSGFTFAQNQIESTLDVSSSPNPNPWKLNYGIEFNENIDMVTVEDVEGGPINQNQFLHSIGLNKKFELGKIGGATLTMKPSISSKLISDQDFLADTDYLREAKISNTLNLDATYGNVKYGMDLKGAYTYAYQYRYRPIDENRETDLSNKQYLFRRNNNRADFSTSMFSDISLDKDYVLGLKIGMSYRDHHDQFFPESRARASIFGNVIDAERDYLDYSAQVSNKVTVNKNFSFSVPFKFSRRNFLQMPAWNEDYAFGDPNGPKNKNNTYTVAFKPKFTSQYFDMSVGLTAGRIEDKGTIYQSDDADIINLASGMTFKFTDLISLDLNYEYDEWAADFQNELLVFQTNIYSTSLSISKPFGIENLDSSLTYELTDHNFIVPFFNGRNQSASLDLNYKL